MSEDSNLAPLSHPVYLPEALANQQWLRFALEAFDETTLDREWVVRNLIGGMAAGFGLRGEIY